MNLLEPVFYNIPTKVFKNENNKQITKKSTK